MPGRFTTPELLRFGRGDGHVEGLRNGVSLATQTNEQNFYALRHPIDIAQPKFGRRNDRHMVLICAVAPPVSLGVSH